MNSQKQNDALRPEQQLIDHLLKDIEELKEVNEKYQKELQISKNFENLEKDNLDLINKFKQEKEQNYILKEHLKCFLKELEGKNVEKEIKQFLTAISFH